MTQIIRKSEAKSLGLTRYFTGKSCPQGHVAERSVCDGKCIECKKVSKRASYAKNADEINKRRRAINAENPERIRLANKKWREANPEKARENFRKWALANPERIREIARKSYQKNADKHKIYRRKRYLANPAQSLADKHKRRARKAAAEGAHAPKDIAEIRKAQKDRCGCCGIKLKGKGHVDHIQPLALGGSNWPRNLQLLCERCNLSKNARDPIEFMQTQGRLL